MKSINIFLAIGSLVSLVEAGTTGVYWKSEGIIEWSDYCTINGQEIARFLDVENAVEDCGLLCFKNPDCKFFEANGKEKVCVLKIEHSSLAALPWYTEVSVRYKRCGFIINRAFFLKPSPIVVQKPTPAPKTSPPKTGTFQWKDNCRLEDYNLENRKVKDHIECGEACFYTPNCTHFVYLKDSPWCTLKQAKAIEEIVALFSICGVVNSRGNSIRQWKKTNSEEQTFRKEQILSPLNSDVQPKTGYFQWKENCNLANYTIEARKVKDHIECGKACFDSQNCTHFVYKKINSWCALKEAKEIDEIVDSLFICGVVNSRGNSILQWKKTNSEGQSIKEEQISSPPTSDAPPTKGMFLWKENCNLANYTIESRKVKDHIECGKACFYSQNCTHFVYIKKHSWCALKEAKEINEIVDSLVICGFISSREVKEEQVPSLVTLNKLVLVQELLNEAGIGKSPEYFIHNL